MMKRLITILLAFISISAFAQSDVKRGTAVSSNPGAANYNKQRIIDDNLKIALTFGIPTGTAFTHNNSNPAVGNIFYNTSTNQFAVWTGSVWKVIGDADLTNYYTKPESDGRYIFASPSETQTAFIKISEKIDALKGATLGGDAYKRIDGVVNISGIASGGSFGAKPALSIFGGASYNESTPFVSIWGEDALGGNYDLLNVRSVTEQVFRVKSNGKIVFAQNPALDALPTQVITRDAATGELKYVASTSLGGGGSSYVLPTATASVLGGIKVGSGLSINSTSGVLSAIPTDLSNYYNKPQVDAGFIQNIGLFVSPSAVQTAGININGNALFNGYMLSNGFQLTDQPNTPNTAGYDITQQFDIVDMRWHQNTDTGIGHVLRYYKDGSGRLVYGGWDNVFQTQGGIFELASGFKITKVPSVGSATDSVLVRNIDGTIKQVASSSFGGGGGSAVSSVFGRAGVVTAQSGDYSSFYYPLSANPANYLTSVPAQSFASLTGKPTTLSGYGITDAYPLTGNPSGFLTSYTETDPLFDTKFAAKTTTGLTEGSNLYYTAARFNTAFSGKSTTDLTEGSNLYFTQTRVSANTDVTANTAARHSAVTIDTSNGLSLVGQALSLGLSSAGVTGALSGTDWSTFNNKLSTAIAASTYVPYTGATGSVDLGANSLTSSANILTGVSSPAYVQGKLVYDTDNESLTFYNNDANIGLQIGQEEWIKVVNNTGSTIANGSAVYVNGSSGGVPTIALANASAAATTVGVGLTTESIANGATGYVTALGLVRGLNTAAFSVGAVYISETTPGALTQTAPVAPNYRYRVGFVTSVNASTGTIHVTPSTAALGNGTANQVFGMNAAGTGQEVKTIIGAGGITVNHTANTVTITGSGGGATFADPTASIGLTAVNGVATTAMRSDAAPALSQAISPNWSGVHTFGNTVTYSALTATTTLGLDASKNVVSITNTGTGNAVRQTTPTLITPVLGVATVTSINKVNITAPTTSATLTLVTGSTLQTTGAFALNLTTTAASTPTFPAGAGTLPYLGGNNTWGGTNTYSAKITANNQVDLAGARTQVGFVGNAGSIAGQSGNQFPLVFPSSLYIASANAFRYSGIMTTASTSVAGAYNWNFYVNSTADNNNTGGITALTIAQDGKAEASVAPTAPNGLVRLTDLQTNSSKAVSTKTANYTVALTDYTLLASTASTAITFTLPTAASAYDATSGTGRIYNFKRNDAGATNAMVIATANGTDTIDGSTASRSTTTAYGSLTFQAVSATSWIIIL